jgi:hypothetical protein
MGARRGNVTHAEHRAEQAQYIRDLEREESDKDQARQAAVRAEFQRAAIAVATRYDSGGFEDANEADRRVLGDLQNAYRFLLGLND